ncbi:peptidase [Rhodococcus sp. HNM0569]|uniref:peptidase n=1 Tax=Rhodococcus sp. HNM0569 TaxID=2716340 RepID=UPI00146E84B1|nr:peptidase [Rhodococcus sp. HNM0569]NLU85071.1 peptidase [Rhodococcus sp. HNM0569]
MVAERSTDRPVGITPFQASGTLCGFVVSGRWPDSTKEWAQFLALTVRVGALPGLLRTSTVFGVREELPDDPAPDTVGIVIAEGPVLGDDAVAPGHFAAGPPPALLVLHPPSETTPTLPECAGSASGCVLLPGVPHLGLDHRAAWVESDSEGTVSAMVSRVGIDPGCDPDTAVLAMLLAA